MPAQPAEFDLADVVNPRDPRIKRWAERAERYGWEADAERSSEMRKCRFSGDYAGAARIGAEILAARTAALGADHPDTVAARQWHETVKYISMLSQDDQARLGSAEKSQILAESLLTEKNYEGAAEIYRRLSEVRRNLLSGAPRRSARSHPDWAISRTSLSYAISRTDHLAEAEAAAAESVQVYSDFFGRTPNGNLALAEQNLGFINSRKGHWLEALKHYECAAEIRGRLRAARGDQATPRQCCDLAQSLNSRADALNNLGRTDEALKTYEQTFHVLGNIPHAERSRAHHNRGVLHVSRDRLDDAEADLTTALKLRSSVDPMSDDTAYSAYALGELFMATGREKEGRDLHRQALDIRERLLSADASGVTSELLASRRRRGEFMLDDGDAAAAAAYLQGVLTDAQARRVDILGDERDRARMAGRLDLPGLCSSLAAAHLACGMPDAAFDALESGRARALLDLLARGWSGGGPQQSPPTTPSSDVLTAARVRDRLAPGELFLLYSWTPDRVLVAGLRGGSAEPAIIHLIADGRDDVELVDRSINGLAALLRDKRAEDEKFSRFRLNDLLGDSLLAAWKQSSRVIIAPDGPLGAVPFEAFNGDTPDKHVFVADTDIEIVYTPSASMYFTPLPRSELPAGERTPTLERGRALALGVNNFVPNHMCAARPPELASATRASTSQLAEVLSGQQPLKALTHAEYEARLIAKQLRNAGWDATGILGPEAVVQRFWSELERGAVLIHFATHGLPAGYDPHTAAVALAPAGSAHDVPFITLGALLSRRDRPLNGVHLVVLSACSTHQVVGVGDTPFALSVGFLYAGAERVISTLREIDDRSAADFFGEFYNYLIGKHASSITVFGVLYPPGGPLPPGAALHQARRKFIHKGASAYYWAPFVMIQRAPDG